MRSGHRENLLRVFQSALAAVNGRTCVRAYLERMPVSGNIYMTAVGKAACAMAQLTLLLIEIFISRHRNREI